MCGKIAYIYAPKQMAVQRQSYKWTEINAEICAYLLLQSSRMHESKYSNSDCYCQKYTLQSSRMHELKFAHAKMNQNLQRLQSSRMHESKRGGSPAGQHIIGQLQSSRMHESKRAECPRLRRLRLQSSRMHESKYAAGSTRIAGLAVAILAHAWIKMMQIWRGRYTRPQLQSSRMHESKPDDWPSSVDWLCCNLRACMNQKWWP